MMRLVNILKFALTVGYLFIFAHGAQAQTTDPPYEPGLTDGEWEVVLIHAGSVNIESATAAPVVNGSGTMTVIDGVVSGKYAITGTNFVIGPSSSATGTMTSSGEWTGRADKPGMVDGQTEIEGTVVVDGVSQNISFSFPSTGQVTVIPIIRATCTLVVGDWPYVANNAFSGTGVSASLFGTFLAVRSGAATLGDKEVSYFDKAQSLAVEGAEFIGGIYAGEPVDYRELDSLLSSAEEQYLLLRRQADCGVGDAKDYANFLSGMIRSILQYALEHPKDFTNFHLLRIINAAARTGLIGTGVTISEGVIELGDDLKLDINERERLVLEENDCDGSLALLTIATIFGSPDLVEGIATTIGKVC